MGGKVNNKSTAKCFHSKRCGIWKCWRSFMSWPELLYCGNGQGLQARGLQWKFSHHSAWSLCCDYSSSCLRIHRFVLWHVSKWKFCDSLSQPYTLVFVLQQMTGRQHSFVLGKMCPERHLEGAELLGYDNIRSAKRADAGKILSDTLKKVMDQMKIPNGLSALGYGSEDIPGLVKGAIPQVSNIFNGYFQNWFTLARIFLWCCWLLNWVHILAYSLVLLRVINLGDQKYFRTVWINWLQDLSLKRIWLGSTRTPWRSTKSTLHSQSWFSVSISSRLLHELWQCLDALCDPNLLQLNHQTVWLPNGLDLVSKE